MDIDFFFLLHLLDNLEFFAKKLFESRQRGTKRGGELPGVSKKKDLHILNVFSSSWFVYLGAHTLWTKEGFAWFGDAAALEKREGWQLGSPLSLHSAPR